MSAKQRLVFAGIAVVIAVVGRRAARRRLRRADGPGGPDARHRDDGFDAAGRGHADPGGGLRDATPTPTAEPIEIETVRYSGGKVVGGLARLRFDKGDTARFRIASEVADEVHVHGYDLKKDVPAGGRVTFSFPAGHRGDLRGRARGPRRAAGSAARGSLSAPCAAAASPPRP